MYRIGAVVADEHNLSIIHEDNKKGLVNRATCKENKHRTRHPLLACRKFICNHEFNCEVYASRYQQSRICFKVIQFPCLPVKGSGSCMCQKEMSKRLVRCPCPDEKINVTICLNQLHSLYPLQGDLERSKDNGCRSKVVGVGLLSSRYEKYFVGAYRNPLKLASSPIPKKCTVSGVKMHR